MGRTYTLRAGLSALCVVRGWEALAAAEAGGQANPSRFQLQRRADSQPNKPLR
jgi:hypothetical protein